ncbi:MAG: hypothetical protein K6T63_02630 [Alicyclobacillus herbarius]|uniref:hypothetical protein n=1 Tax=Alicyclobacillus herbarius TaxID=122960 RepID=UPI002352C62C|nr:hypothetical protein [Alicyclobacillus herbarius]MCL6631504.1 hypothetical protein [Alicyclobacillus herbarius]
MSHIPDVTTEMERIRHQQELLATLHNMQEQEKEAVQMATERLLKQCLKRWANEWAANDEHLSVGPSPDNHPGFTITLEGPSLPPVFTVSTKCKGRHVQVLVKDGHWQQMPNVFDKFADWLDQKVVFNGEFKENEIEAALAKAFLAWYQEAIGQQARFQ